MLVLIRSGWPFLFLARLPLVAARLKGFAHGRSPGPEDLPTGEEPYKIG